MKKYLNVPYGIAAAMMLILWGTAGFGQTYRQVILKSNEYYTKNKEIMLHASITAFDHVGDKHGKKLGDLSLHKKGKKFRTLGANHEMICNGKEVLVIDHRGKNAVLFRHNDWIIDKMGASVNDFDTSVVAADSIVRYINTTSEIGFRIYKKTGFISQFEVLYNKKNYALKTFTYFLRNDSNDFKIPYEKMQVVYDDPKVKDTGEPKVDLGDYLKKINGKYTLSGKLGKYKLSVE